MPSQSERSRFTRPKGKARHNAEARYTSSHWGHEPTTVYEVDDPDLPANMTEMGKLRSLDVGMGPRGGVRTIDVAPGVEVREDLILAFEPRQERLYIVLPPDAQDDARRAFWRKGGHVLSLGEANRLAGGRLGDLPVKSPRIRVQVIGPIHRVVYFSTKGEPDDPDGGIDVEFFHDHEESLPLLAVDDTGRLWYLGGDYEVPDEGIAG